MELYIYALFIFSLTALISFSISFQAGPVTLSVMRSAMHNQKSDAFYTALGGSLAEFIYAILAVVTAEILFIYINDWEPIHFIGPMAMIGLGAYLIISANRKFYRGRKIILRQGNAFNKGLVLGLLNPQVYLFYCGVLLAYFQFGFKPSNPFVRYFSFSLGATLGFFLLLALIMYLIRRRGKINNHHFRGSKIAYFCGILLILAGVYQLYTAL